MPRPRKPPHIYRRPGRAGLYAYLDKNQRDIALGTSDEVEAQQALAELVSLRGVRPLAAREGRIADIFKLCRTRAEAANTEKTTYSLHRNLVVVLAWLEARGITGTRQIVQATVEDFKTERRFAGASAARVNRLLDSWRRAMKVAVELEKASPAALGWFKHLREPRPEPHQRGLTKRDLTRFLKACEDRRFKALWRVTLGTAMRDDEVRHMEESDLRPKSVVVGPKPGWTTKGYRYREIPVTADTLKAARDLLRYRAEGFKPCQRYVWGKMKETCTAAKIERFSMHDLRRAWASHMLAAGHKIEDISQWLGHRDVLTTMRYLRVVRQKMPAQSSLPW